MSDCARLSATILLARFAVPAAYVRAGSIRLLATQRNNEEKFAVHPVALPHMSAR